MSLRIKPTVLFLLSISPLPMLAGMRQFSISGLRCQNISCTTAEGIMPHSLTTVEVSTKLPKFAGYSLTLYIVKADNKAVLETRKVGVLADGGVTVSIPAYKLEDGTYMFGLAASNDPKNVIAAGAFKIGPLGQTGSATPVTSAPKLAGHWYGIGGTMADLQLNHDGTYISGGSATGTWRQEGDEVIFTGPLSAWNGGRGKLKPKGDVIEFYWTTPAGAKQYFVIGKY